MSGYVKDAGSIIATGVVPIPRLNYEAERVWARILEAVDVHYDLPDIERPVGVGNTWPDTSPDPAGYGYNDTSVSRDIPTPTQVDRCEEALGWLRILYPRQRRLVLALARGADESWIARRVLKLSRRQRHNFVQTIDDERVKAVRRIVLHLRDCRSHVSVGKSAAEPIKRPSSPVATAPRSNVWRIGL